MTTSTPALSLDAPVPPGPSVAPTALELAAAAPLIAPESASEAAVPDGKVVQGMAEANAPKK